MHVDSSSRSDPEDHTRSRTNLTAIALIPMSQRSSGDSFARMTFASVDFTVQSPLGESSYIKRCGAEGVDGGKGRGTLNVNQQYPK